MNIDRKYISNKTIAFHFINIIVCFFILLYVLSNASFGASVQVGDIAYISDKTITLNCSGITDGNGVGIGKMRFRTKQVAAETWKPWTEYQDFSQSTVIDFPSMEIGKEYQIQGQFCDLLGNCQTEEQAVIAQQTIKCVETNITGEINIKIDFILEMGK